MLLPIAHCPLLIAELFEFNIVLFDDARPALALGDGSAREDAGRGNSGEAVHTGSCNIPCGYLTLLMQVKYLAEYERTRSAAQSGVSQSDSTE